MTIDLRQQAVALSAVRQDDGTWHVSAAVNGLRIGFTLLLSEGQAVGLLESLKGQIEPEDVPA